MIRLSSFYDHIRTLNVLDDVPVEDNTVSVSYYNLPDSISSVIREFAPQPERKVRLTRREIFEERDTRKKIIKILVWGYSNDSRGNASGALRDNLAALTAFFDKHQGKEIKQEVVKELFGFPHIRISTASKILYFMKVRINGHPAIVVDSRVQEALPLFEELHGLPRGDNEGSYVKTVAAIGSIARANRLEPDQMEYFLFGVGKAWSSYIADKISDLRKEEEANADKGLMERLLKAGAKERPSSRDADGPRTVTPSKVGGLKVVGSFYHRAGRCQLFRGMGTFEFCKALLDSDEDIDSVLDKDFLRRFEKKGRKRLNYRYHRFGGESESEKAAFFEAAKEQLKRIAK